MKHASSIDFTDRCVRSTPYPLAVGLARRVQMRFLLVGVSSVARLTRLVKRRDKGFRVARTWNLGGRFPKIASSCYPPCHGDREGHLRIF
jgi:hypothetical protein